MKTSDLFILISALAYSYLFYHQQEGINFLLFNVLIAVLFFLNDRNLISKPSWLAVAGGSLLSSFFIFYWGTPLTVLANICSLSMLAGLSFNPEASILVASFNTGISVITSLPRFIAGTATSASNESGNGGVFKRLLLFIAPLIISMVFVLVYRAANPIFKQFTDQINLDFISLSWCIFTLTGFLIMFGFFKYYPVDMVDQTDKNAPDNLPFITLEDHLRKQIKGLTVSAELLTGIILLVMLNVVLLCVNGLDVFYMWIAARLPSGISLDAYLHDGANTLIFSIVMAIAIILFVFRGYLNFFEKNQWLKTLAYIWIAQNALLVITTANRNWWTIETWGFTRRRIGVYVYLLLCMAGLFTTFLKVMYKKSNWFLFRKNAWAFYAVFMMACFINWDELIVNYNCKNGNDRYYQSRLSHTCLASLFKDWAAERKQINIPKTEFTSVAIGNMYRSYEDLTYEASSTGWQSFCISKRQNLDEINRMIKDGEIPAR